MSESKQDVFNAAMRDYDEVFGCAVDHGYYGDALTAGEYRTRYAVAGKVAVPREVGKAIDGAQAAHRNLSWTLQEADNRYTSLYYRAGLWITTQQDQFAEAWIHGWYAEEDTK
jgi:hypothetical protein